MELVKELVSFHFLNDSNEYFQCYVWNAENTETDPFPSIFVKNSRIHPRMALNFAEDFILFLHVIAFEA